MGNFAFTVEQLTDQNVIDQLAEANCDCDITLDDGVITLHSNLVVFNAIFWSIYVHFRKTYPKMGIVIDKEHVFFPDRSVDKTTGIVSYSFTSETVMRCCCEIYNELILKYRLKHHMEAVAKVWDVIGRFTGFADKHTRKYQVSLDALSLSELCAQAPIKEVIERTLDDSHGTKFAEKQMEQLTDDLMKRLRQPGLIADNVLMPFMLVKLLKRNQVPQMFGAFGPRSDITDEMMSHSISASAFSGLSGVEDFAIESLSAKKAEYFNSAVIQEAQYFARRCRLGASRMPKLYPGSCGSTVTIPVVINPKHKKNYYGKFVKVDDSTRHLISKMKYRLYDDDSVELTPANIDLFTNRRIQMWSPFGCRHTDGICEHCAGFMHQHLQGYIPEGIHLGIFCTTKTVSAVTQKILSAKHLIKTSSKDYVFQPKVAKYLTKIGDAVIWLPQVVKAMKRCSLRLENTSFLGPLHDLTRDNLPTGVSFSKVARIGLVNDKGTVVDLLELADESTCPYFSNYMMEYLKKNYERLSVDPDYIDIPLDNFDFDRPFLKFTSVNDDMVAFVHRVDKFVMNQIRDYTSIEACLRDFSELIYAKTDVNIFAIEVMLRSYLLDPNGPKIPVITDIEAPVRFAGLGDVISGAALSTKLSYEGVKAYFADPDPTLNTVGAGYGFNDPMFNFSRCS